MGRIILIAIIVISLGGCWTVRETHRAKDEGKKERIYDKNYDTIRYFDSTFVRTIQTDSLREILRERVILGEKTVREIHHDTLLQWQKDTIYIKEETKEKEEKTAFPWVSALMIGILVILILFFIYKV